MAEEQELRGHSSSQILNLKKRLPKAWKWVDWVLSPSCTKENLKRDVVLCLFNKALPTKIEGDGIGGNVLVNIVRAAEQMTSDVQRPVDTEAR